MMRKKHGMTLIELIAAASIVVMGAIIVIKIEPILYTAKEKIDQSSTCVFLALEKMEDIRGAMLSDFEGDPETGYAEPETAFLEPNDAYRYTVTDDMDENLKTISINVWPSDNTDNIFPLSTKIAKRT